MGTLSIWHWVVVLIIVVMIFGTNKLKNIGKDAGEAVKGFKDALNSTSEETKSEKHNIDNKKSDI